MTVEKQLLLPREAAEWLRISERSVYRLIAEGKLEIVKIRNSTRIFAESLNQYLEKQLEQTRLDNGIPECRIQSCPTFRARQ